MTTQTTVTVTITLRRGADPIEGSFRRASEAAHTFHGWLELTSLLQAAARAPGGPSAPDGAPAGESP